MVRQPSVVSVVEEEERRGGGEEEERRRRGRGRVKDIINCY